MKIKISYKLMAATALYLTAPLVVAQERIADNTKGVRDLIDATGGQAQVSVNKRTGLARFVRLPQENRLSSTTSEAVARLMPPPQQRAFGFLSTHADAFGISDIKSELTTVGTTRDAMGNQHLVFKQTYNGLPVFGAELRAHFNGNGDLFAVNSSFASQINVKTVPNITSDVAIERAIRTVGVQQYNRAKAASALGDTVADPDEKFDNLNAVVSNLMVFRAGLVQGVPGRDHLAFEVEVTNPKLTVREFVYVDAHNGKVIDQITGIHDALYRRAYDGQFLSTVPPGYPGTPFWEEGDAFPTTEVEADNMILASAETYDFFLNAFGRDSFDGAGATMDSIFNRGYSCPNASWNGTFISFCNGLTTDDITGHEWGHAYTDYTSNLIYQWQSGALNESYSDIWGETVDLINGRGWDSPGGLRTDGSCSNYGPGGPGDDSVRWLEGEEYGALRDMWNPTCAGDPGKVSDSEYYCDTGDSGGVHYNSGVPNHAFALMVDGGSYNGYSGVGLGLTKSVHIQWAASNLLIAASNFADNADALEAACTSLIGVDLNDLLTGAPSGELIDGGDCTQVSGIIAAVEFRTPPDQCGFETLLAQDAPALCEGLGSVNTVALEDFESGSLPAGWTASAHDVADPNTFDSPGWSVDSGLPSGNGSTYSAFAPDIIEGNCDADTEAGAVALDSPAILLPANEAPHVAFDHWVATETGWDGGNLKVSVNGGPWTVVPGVAYSFNPYNATMNVSDNPLGGEEGFTGSDGGSVSGSWGQSQVDLYGLAYPGDTVQLRFDLGTDGCNGLVGWYVDNVHVYSCSDEVLPFCGDGLLDLGESCDDGNMANGDGCSSSCAVESGWVCTDPMPSNPNGTNLIADWSFENSFNSGEWTPFSTFGGVAGFPLCTPDNGCSVTSLARTGSSLVWIGGLSGGVTSTVDQDITIPAAAAELTIYTYRGVCDDPSDTLHVQIDGNDIGTLACDATDGDWTEQTFPVAPYNDGGSHNILIGGTVGGTNGTHSNFFVEDVVLSDNTPTDAEPSICTEIVEVLACNAGTVEFDDGIADSWTVVDNEGTGVIWTNIEDSEIGGNYTGGTGDAASVNSDATPFTDYDTELVSNPFSLQNQASASLDYLANFRNYVEGADTLDVDITTDGGNSWTNLLSWSEDHGGFRSAPGEAVSIDLGAYLGEPDVQVRWHYYNPNTGGDWDWYAQVDNVSLTAPDDADCDGVVDSIDACPGTMIPETAPANGLGKNRWILLDSDNVFDTNGKQSPAYTIQDTAGCSCEQIIESLGLGDGHARFGCSNSNMKSWINQVSQ